MYIIRDIKRLILPVFFLFVFFKFWMIFLEDGFYVSVVGSVFMSVCEGNETLAESN